MRILFLSQVLPYPVDAGPKARAYHVLRRLAARHELTLASFVRRGDAPSALAHLHGFCESIRTALMERSAARDAWHFGRSLASGEPFLIARDRSLEMTSVVRELAASRAYDAVHADQLWMAPYALLAARAAGRPGPRLVLDQHNAVFQIPARLAEAADNPARRLLLQLEARKLASYEQRVCERFDRVVWVTDDDRRALEGVGGASVAEASWPARSTTIPICLDPVQQPAIGTANGRRVTFLGGLHWPPNAAGLLWFARAIWPRIQTAAPDAVLTVIGKSPPPELVRLAERSPGLEVFGYLADPAELLAETAVFVVPLQAGGGMRVKILDAWTRGLPVVSTTLGAEGLLASDGDNILLADDVPSFAEAVVRLLADRALAARLAAGGRRTVERHYDWRIAYAAWDRLYDALAEPPPSFASLEAGAG